MPRRYAKPYRKRTTRRKKIYRKKFNIRRKKHIYYFSRYVNYSTVLLTSASPTAVAFSFSLNDVPNYTEFTALYDMYKIKAIKVYFYPAMTESVSTSTTNAPAGETRCITALDRNDATATSFDDLRQYQNAKVFQLNRRHTRYIYKPMIFDTTGYSVSPWLACTSPSVNYYGLKFAAEPTAQSVGNYLYTIEAKFYMAFKSVR